MTKATQSEGRTARVGSREDADRGLRIRRHRLGHGGTGRAGKTWVVAAGRVCACSWAGAAGNTGAAGVGTAGVATAGGGTAGLRPLVARQPRPVRRRCHPGAEAVEELRRPTAWRGASTSLAPSCASLPPTCAWHLVAQHSGAAVVVVQMDLRAALGEAGDAALPFPTDRIAVRRVHIGQLHIAGKAGGDRPDLHRGCRLHRRIRLSFPGFHNPGW